MKNFTQKMKMKKIYSVLFLFLCVKCFGVSTFTITTTELPTGYTEHAYSKTLKATGGVPPYTWTVSSGALPNGTQLQRSTGLIGGYLSLQRDTQIVFSITAFDNATSPASCVKTYTLTSIDYRFPRTTIVENLAQIWTRTNIPRTYGETWDTWNNMVNDTTTFISGAGATVSGVYPTYTISATGNSPNVSTLVGNGLISVSGSPNVTVSAGTIYSNTFSPIITPLANISAVVGKGSQYMRVGDIVTVSTSFNADLIANTSQTAFTVSLPINASVSDIYFAGGSGSYLSTNSTSYGFLVQGVNGSTVGCEFTNASEHGFTNFTVIYTYTLTQ